MSHLSLACFARTSAGFVVLLIGFAGYEERLVIGDIPANPFIFGLAAVWVSSLRLEIEDLRKIWLWQIPLIPVGLTIMWSPDAAYGAYKFFNLLLASNLALLLWLSVIKEFGEEALGRTLIGLLIILLAVALVYKYRNGLFDRSVNFFLQGPITFGRLMAFGLVLSVFFLSGLARVCVGGIFLMALVWTGSKGPILAIVLTLLVMLWAMESRLRNRILFLFGLLMLVVVRITADLDLGIFRLDRLGLLWSIDTSALTRQGEYDSFTARYWMAVNTLDLIASRPFGIGLGGWPILVSNNLGQSYPHNLLLELWSECGLLIGTVAASSFIAFFMSRRSVWKYIALFYFISQMFSGDLLDARYILTFAMLSYFSTRRYGPIS